MKNSLWTEEEKRFLKNNFNDMTNAELSEKMNRTKSAIQTKLNDLGLKRFDKYFYNKNFFEKIDTEEKAYWFGFICADGYVVLGDTNAEVGIELTWRDSSHLKKFNKSLQGNIPVTKKKERKNARICPKDGIASFRIYSVKMVNDLIRLGCVQRKSSSLEFPIIPNEFFFSFVRGYFDGNGSVISNNQTDTFRFSFSTGSLKMAQGLVEELKKHGVLSYYCVEKERKDNRFKNQIRKKAYKVYITGLRNSLTFFLCLYKDASIYLERKLNKAISLIESRNLIQRCKKIRENSDCLSIWQQIVTNRERNGEAETPIRMEGCV